MKRMLAVMLAAVLLLGLTACGGGEDGNAEAQPLTVPGVDPKSGEWIGQGGCYTLAPCEDTQTGVLGFSYEGQDYTVRNDWNRHGLYLGEEAIYETEQERFLYNAVPDSEGIWLAEEERDGDDWYVHFVRLTGDGEEQSRVRRKLPEGGFGLSFTGDGTWLYLNCADALRIYDREGTLTASIPHEAWGGQLLKSGGDVFYLEEAEAGGGTLYAIDVPGGGILPLFSFDQGLLYAGDERAPFLLLKREGIDRVQLNGSAEPLVIWEECGLSAGGVMSVKARDDGSYLRDGITPLLLVPAEPSALKARVKLTIGVLNGFSGQVDFAEGNANLMREATAFNAVSPDCYVEVLDLTEGGSLTPEQALTRLNTQFLAGESPDMLVFDNRYLSPFPYIRRGLLRDLDAEFIEQDGDFSLEDIVIAPAIQRDCGGLYVLGSRFSLETRYALQSRFGKVWGWDYDTYRQIDQETPEGCMVMYNLTREYFLREGASRFIRRAIDWQTGSCDFDNEDFVKLLTASRDMRETPEDANNMVFGAPATLLNEGYMATALYSINRPEDYARAGREAGSPLSFIGFPTPDGSCGTDLSFGECLGILTATEHPGECWRFLKYSLQHNEYGLPVYRPLLEERVKEAMREKEEDETETFQTGLISPMTEAEVQDFYELLDHVEHTTLYDSTALAIIREEFEGVLAGDKSPRDAARLVQSRVSLYVAEQAG